MQPQPSVPAFDPSAYLGRTYDDPPCWALVADVMHAQFGEAATGYKSINGTIRELATTFRLTLHESSTGFTRLAEPADLCMVLLGSNTKLGLHHCGVYWQGRVLHALPEGVVYEPISSVRDAFAQVEFWGRL